MCVCVYIYIYKYGLITCASRFTDFAQPKCLYNKINTIFIIMILAITHIGDDEIICTMKELVQRIKEAQKTCTKLIYLDIILQTMLLNRQWVTKNPHIRRLMEEKVSAISVRWKLGMMYHHKLHQIAIDRQAATTQLCISRSTPRSIPPPTP